MVSASPVSRPESATETVTPRPSKPKLWTRAGFPGVPSSPIRLSVAISSTSFIRPAGSIHSTDSDRARSRMRPGLVLPPKKMPKAVSVRWTGPLNWRSAEINAAGGVWGLSSRRIFLGIWGSAAIAAVRRRSIRHSGWYSPSHRTNGMARISAVEAASRWQTKESSGTGLSRRSRLDCRVSRCSADRGPSN